MVGDRTTAAALACILAVVLSPRGVRADCGPPPADPALVYPTDQQDDVPLDTKVFAVDGISSIRLNGEPLHEVEKGIWDPGQILEPEQVYELEFIGSNDETWQTSFTTGSAPFSASSEPSAAPCRGRAWPSDLPNACARMGGACIDDLVPFDGVEFRVESGDAVFWVLQSEYLFLAMASCTHSPTIPSASPCAPTLKATAYAPNGSILFSELWEETVPLCDEIGEPVWDCASDDAGEPQIDGGVTSSHWPACACKTGSHSSPGRWIVLMFWCVAFPMRKRRRSPRLAPTEKGRPHEFPVWPVALSIAGMTFGGCPIEHPEPTTLWRPCEDAADCEEEDPALVDLDCLSSSPDGGAMVCTRACSQTEDCPYQDEVCTLDVRCNSDGRCQPTYSTPCE